MDLVAVVLEVDVKKRTARICAQFESHAQAEVSANAMSDMVKQSWYKGNKDFVYHQVHHDRVKDWAVCYGFLIIS